MLYGRIILAGSLVVVTMVPNLGCLRRKETITVSPDQSVRIELLYEGGSADFGKPDAMPSKESGWDAETIAKKQDNGDMEYTLTAGRSFEPGAPLPRNFAAPGDPDTELYLDFPTKLEVERRDDGTVYTLRRVYTARPWAYVQYWEDRVMEGDVKKLLDKPEDDLTGEEKEKVLRALASVEVLRRLELSHTALERGGIEAYETAWLEARQALIDHVDEIDFEPILALQRQVESAADDSPEKEAAEERMQHAISGISDGVLKTFEDQLRASLGEARFVEYDRALQRVLREYEISKEAGAHQFEIRVKMPGRVIGHNGDKVEEDGTVVWEFEGKAFRDRDHELLVVSRLQSPAGETNR